MISAKVVKELRERTGAGMMACKKALTETNGDMDKAIEVLREKGLAAAAKKAGRIAAEGLIQTYISEDKKVGSVVEVNCETDFVAANQDFVNFTKSVAEKAATSNAANLEELLKETVVMEGQEMTIADATTALIAKLGENMAVRRFLKFTVENGIIHKYMHGEGRIGVLVQLSCEKESPVLEEVAKEVAMHIAAANPLFLNRDQVDNETLEKEKEIYRVQALNEGKPEKIVEKMVMGRINKYYKENCLVDQLWIRDDKLTISKYLQEKSKEVGSEIKIDNFARFERGEGIEKKEEDFAQEVQKQMKQGN